MKAVLRLKTIKLTAYRLSVILIPITFFLQLSVSGWSQTAGYNGPVCEGSNLTLTGGPDGAASYLWTGPNLFTSTLQSPVVSTSATVAMAGDYTLQINGDPLTTATVTVVVNTVPGAAGTITGSTAVCVGLSYTYSIATVAGADSYTWTLPSGWSGSSGTESIIATAGAAGGTITVTANNGCGAGTPSALGVTANTVPGQPGAITGTAIACQGSSYAYSITAVAGAASYTWTLPSGWSGTSTTESITATAGAAGGTVSVTANNECGSGAAATFNVSVITVPSQPGPIGGAAIICQETSQIYSIATVPGATSYSWTLPAGWSGISATESITALAGIAGGIISVTASNGCGSGTSSSLGITVNPLPSPAGSITGSMAVCQGQSSVTYSILPVLDATSYVWTLPAGATGSSSINTITVNYGVSAVSGNVTVKGSNSCGFGTASSMPVTVDLLPLAAGAITGSTTVCQGETAVIYSVPAVTNATSYIWTLPTGATGTSSVNTITVNYGTSAVSGSVTVKGSNSCGDGPSSSLAIIVNPLPLAGGPITGSTTVCQGQAAVNYTVPAISNALSYIWTLPSGATGTSSTNSITVDYGATGLSGSIGVKGSNACGTGLPSTLAITVNPLPSAAGIISGSASVCQGQSAVTYSVPAILNATSYKWTLPSGATGTSTTNSITVSFGLAATSGNITVKGNNACGDGIQSTLAITVNPVTGAAGTITGSSIVCQGQLAVAYTVPAIAAATSYVWTLPSGATGSSTTNSIAVNYGNAAVSEILPYTGLMPVAMELRHHCSLQLILCR